MLQYGTLTETILPIIGVTIGPCGPPFSTFKIVLYHAITARHHPMTTCRFQQHRQYYKAPSSQLAQQKGRLNELSTGRAEAIDV